MSRFLCAIANLVALTLSEASAADRAIARVWHGKTATEKAVEYAEYLVGEIHWFRKLSGNLGFQMRRQTSGGEMHFMRISFWTSLDAITAYAGLDIQVEYPLAWGAERLSATPTPTHRSYRWIQP